VAIPIGLALGASLGVHLAFLVGSYMPRVWQPKDIRKIVGIVGIDNQRVFVRKFNEEGKAVYQICARKGDGSESLLTIRTTKDVVNTLEEPALLDSGVLTVDALTEDTTWKWANWAFWNTDDVEPLSYSLTVPPGSVQFTYGPVTEE
jgi:hypothetical protein